MRWSTPTLSDWRHSFTEARAWRSRSNIESLSQAGRGLWVAGYRRSWLHGLAREIGLCLQALTAARRTRTLKR